MGRPVPYAFLFSLPYASKLVSPPVVNTGFYGGYTRKDWPHLSDLFGIRAFLKTGATEPLATKNLQYVLQPREYVYDSICHKCGES